MFSNFKQPIKKILYSVKEDIALLLVDGKVIHRVLDFSGWLGNTEGCVEDFKKLPLNRKFSYLENDLEDIKSYATTQELLEHARNNTIFNTVNYIEL